MYGLKRVVVVGVVVGLVCAVRNALGIPHRTCRYEPCCTSYARDALLHKTPWRAIGLIAWRILRCNPFCRGGYDPVVWCEE